MTLSKTDTNALNRMLQHAESGNVATFERLIAAWVRSAPSDLVLAKRMAAISAIPERMRGARTLGSSTWAGSRHF